MDIVLVKPCWRYPISGADHTYNRRWPPLELLNCAALLEAAGHRVRLLDAQAEGLSPEQLGRRVGAAEVALLSTSALDRWQCPSFQLEPVRAAAEQLRPRAARLFVTGFHGTVAPELILRMTAADAVIRGEPEAVVCRLVESERFEDVPGLTFWAHGQHGAEAEHPHSPAQAETQGAIPPSPSSKGKEGENRLPTSHFAGQGGERSEPDEGTPESDSGGLSDEQLLPSALTPGCSSKPRGEQGEPQNRRVVSTPDADPVELNTLPVPALHLLDLRHYHYEILGSRFVVLEGSRGCAAACTFCTRLMLGKRRREKTPERLADEVKQAIELGARNIYFIDLEFTARRAFVEEFCRLMLHRRLRVRWCCQTRTDQVDAPLLKLMRRAGCRLIHYGVETASPRVAALMRKPIRWEVHQRAIELTHAAGMETLCFFLLGYPGETVEEMEQTIRMARQLNPTYASFHRVSPYPGTPLYEQSASQSGEPFPAFAGPPERQELVDRLVRRAIWSYYVRPRYFLGRLLRGSPVSLWRQLRLFAGYFRSRQ